MVRSIRRLPRQVAFVLPLLILGACSGAPKTLEKAPTKPLEPKPSVVVPKFSTSKRAFARSWMR